LAKSAFDDAIQSIDQANMQMDQTMRDSLTILQLLRDDLILWAAELRNQ
jgi:14-3-3 protein epsilon